MACLEESMSSFETNSIHFSGGKRHEEKLVSCRGNAYMLYYRSDALSRRSLDERYAMNVDTYVESLT